MIVPLQNMSPWVGLWLLLSIISVARNTMLLKTGEGAGIVGSSAGKPRNDLSGFAWPLRPVAAIVLNPSLACSGVPDDAETAVSTPVWPAGTAISGWSNGAR